MCCDTTDLFQIIIHSYSQLSSGGKDGEEDVFSENQVDFVKNKVLLITNKRAELELEMSLHEQFFIYFCDQPGLWRSVFPVTR